DRDTATSVESLPRKENLVSPYQGSDDFFTALLEEKTPPLKTTQNSILYDENWLLIPKDSSYDPLTLNRELEEEQETKPVAIYYPVNRSNLEDLFIYCLMFPCGFMIWYAQAHGGCEERGYFRNFLIGGNVAGVGLRISSEYVGTHPCCTKCSKCWRCFTCATCSCFGFRCCGCFRTERGNEVKGKIYLEQEEVKGTRENPYKNLLVLVHERSLSTRDSYLTTRPCFSYFLCSRDRFKEGRQGVEYICCCIRHREINEPIPIT
ncbi:MAG: hypothetical protein AAF335_05015, partial [Bacteroidota bacterium]